MGALLQKLLHRVLFEDAAHPNHHVTATLGCCSTILIDEHETAPPNKEDSSDDSSDLG